MNKKCQCKELEFTNQYSDSYKCKKCGRLFVVTHSGKLIKETEIFELIKLLEEKEVKQWKNLHRI